MAEKRFTWEYSHHDSTGEIIDCIRNECLMTDYLQKYELEEWCQELNKIVDENNQLRKENGQLKQAYQTLKHRHSLLHDECLETECDRNSLKKDVISLEKENENLNNVLEDFMTITNRLQSEPHNKSLQIMAKDMLRMMGKDIMGDSE